jgi:hypothetical protein
MRDLPKHTVLGITQACVAISTIRYIPGYVLSPGPVLAHCAHSHILEIIATLPNVKDLALKYF